MATYLRGEKHIKQYSAAIVIRFLNRYCSVTNQVGGEFVKARLYIWIYSDTDFQPMSIHLHLGSWEQMIELCRKGKRFQKSGGKKLRFIITWYIKTKANKKMLLLWVRNVVVGIMFLWDTLVYSYNILLLNHSLFIIIHEISQSFK